MTTLKEYKAMMEGATDAPWTYEPQEFMPERVWKGTKQICHVIGDSGETQANADFIAASRNIAPSLIRVIELADEALNLADNVLWADIASGAFPQRKFTRDMVDRALSEIRKLKGE